MRKLHDTSRAETLLKAFQLRDADILAHNAAMGAEPLNLALFAVLLFAAGFLLDRGTR